MDYDDFIARKRIAAHDHGIDPSPMPERMFKFQRRVTEFALRKGRAALFMDTGLGKTICQVEWARQIPGKKLILAPVAVAQQTVREAAEKNGVEIIHSRDGSAKSDITITNYERLHLFDPDEFGGIVLDESSILKSMMGKTKQKLCDAFSRTKYRLACTATPAPNDYTELGNHAEFLGEMPQNEMLARWFVNDSSDTGTWRLKGHAVKDFWGWFASWAACVGKPTDAGGDATEDAMFALPPLKTRVHVEDQQLVPNIDTGCLFGTAELSATTMHTDKRNSLESRVGRVADIVANSPDYSIVWCETNAESSALAKAIPESVDVTGSDDPDEKEAKLDAFSRGEVRRIISKPSICGFGLNWQHCAHVVFASLNYSYEGFYQAIRRSWRFGQTREVNVDVVIASTEQGIWQAIRRKMSDHDTMKGEMRFAKFSDSTYSKSKYNPNHKAKLPSWIK